MQTRSRHVVVVAFDEVDLLDVTAPLDVLSRAGRGWNFRPFKVEICAAAPGLVTTRNQLRIEAPVALASTRPADVLWIPGGYGARRLLDDGSFASELARVGNTAETVAAVGWGVALLARAGLAGDARLATSTEVGNAVLAATPSAVVDSKVPLVTTTRIKTARASGAALELALSIVTASFGAKVTAMVLNDLELSPLSVPQRIELKY